MEACCSRGGERSSGIVVHLAEQDISRDAEVGKGKLKQFVHNVKMDHDKKGARTAWGVCS